MMVSSRQGLPRLQQEFLSSLGGLDTVFEAELGSTDFRVQNCEIVKIECW